MTLRQAGRSARFFMPPPREAGQTFHVKYHVAAGP